MSSIAQRIDTIHRGVQQRARELYSPAQIGTFVADEINKMVLEHKTQAANRIQKKAIELTTKIVGKLSEAERIDEARLPALALRYKAMPTKELVAARSNDMTTMMVIGSELRSRGKEKDADVAAFIAAEIPRDAIRKDGELQLQISDLGTIHGWHNNAKWVVLDDDRDIHRESKVRFSPVMDYVDHVLKDLPNAKEIKMVVGRVMDRDGVENPVSSLAGTISNVTQWHDFNVSNGARLAKLEPQMRKELFGEAPIPEPASNGEPTEDGAAGSA